MLAAKHVGSWAAMPFPENSDSQHVYIMSQNTTQNSLMRVSFKLNIHLMSICICQTFLSVELAVTSACGRIKAYNVYISKREVIEKASSTLRTSRAVTHPSTIRALRCLTSEFGRDPVFSSQYGRWQVSDLWSKRCNLQKKDIIKKLN